MLILTRKVGEIIRIGDDITVKVLALRGGQVSLGFTAPSAVKIFREEVLLADAAAAAAAEPVKAKPAREALQSAAVRSGDGAARRD